VIFLNSYQPNISEY